VPAAPRSEPAPGVPRNVKSTYFVLLTSDYYNVFSKESYSCIRKILSCGHEIGLHFDEVRYPELEGNIEMIKEKIMEECEILGHAIGGAVTTVSMHRPSKMMLEANLEIPGIVNSYGFDFYKGFKYLSDSRRRWRESVDEIIESAEYKRLHILTHAFWYHEQELNMQDSLLSFINAGNTKRFSIMNENFTRLEDEINVNQVLRRQVDGD
ncbi:MAG: hypothetical protein K2I47_05285, partial [Odoribacter sp.]|nr:hypothetical protein [Odoribacter sp.]